MELNVRVNGIETNELFLISPVDEISFPVPIEISTKDGNNRTVQLALTGDTAAVEISETEVSVGADPVVVEIMGIRQSTTRNGTVINITIGGARMHMLNVTVISDPRINYDGRFEVRFATNNDAYNNPRGNPDGTGDGWMWALEGEPDFVPDDSVPDRIEKPVGRVIRFHDPAVERIHVPPIGVFVTSVTGNIQTGAESFQTGDPIIGTKVNLGPHSYFASNLPVSPTDDAAGRLPEEQHSDGFQPIANFQFNIGDVFTGGSKVGPYVPGTVLSPSPRTPDDRPYADNLWPLSQQERIAFPHPSLAEFETARVSQLAPELNQLKAQGQVNTREVRNLVTRIGHLLQRLEPSLRAQLLSDHSDVGLQPLGSSANFAWGQREIYRGMINADIVARGTLPGVSKYLTSKDYYYFLCVFFNFHTDESRAHCYGAIAADAAPPTMEQAPIADILVARAERTMM